MYNLTKFKRQTKNFTGKLVLENCVFYYLLCIKSMFIFGFIFSNQFVYEANKKNENFPNGMQIDILLCQLSNFYKPCTQRNEYLISQEFRNLLKFIVRIDLLLLLEFT